MNFKSNNFFLNFPAPVNFSLYFLCVDISTVYCGGSQNLQIEWTGSLCFSIPLNQSLIKSDKM